MSPKICVAFGVGWLRMFSSAVTVSVGVVPPGGVASVNNDAQLLLLPAVPVVFTHAARMLPSVLISVEFTENPLGMFVPGDVPLAVLTSSPAKTKSACKTGESYLDAPMLVGPDINKCSAATAATVLSSFTVTVVLLVRELHSPSADINVRLALVPDPGLPPVTTRNTSVAVPQV